MIAQILKKALELQASDIIISSDAFPYFKIDGDVVPVEWFENISKGDIENELFSIMSERQKEKFLKELEFDFAIDLKGEARFRVNAFYQKRGVSVVFRYIRNELPNFEDLHLPKQVLDFVNRKSGLVLITGWVGTGKSTTMSVLVDYINKNFKRHIITVEDPVEFVFKNEKSLIEQREVWLHTHSFENGLKYALRQASDVIMVGEMRDLETFRLALRAAETGNLVIATLHTSGAARTIARVIDMFPADEKDQIKQQVSESLVAVVWQDLLKRWDWKGRIPAVEILVNSTNVSNMIRRGNTHQLDSAIETGKSYGMIPMKKSLERLFEEKLISQQAFDDYLAYLGRSDETI